MAAKSPAKTQVLSIGPSVQDVALHFPFPAFPGGLPSLVNKPLAASQGILDEFMSRNHPNIAFRMATLPFMGDARNRSPGLMDQCMRTVWFLRGAGGHAGNQDGEAVPPKWKGRLGKEEMNTKSFSN